VIGGEPLARVEVSLEPAGKPLESHTTSAVKSR
jgi:hypothetical protein